jgi:HD-like signal output (HDOD) protein
VNVQELVRAWSELDVPVLASTVAAVRRLKLDEERVGGREIARVVLRDPLMTLRVLRYADARRSARQPTDITTVAHAVMMHGVTNFFRAFSAAPSLESLLGAHPSALAGALAVVSRAHHAATYAQAIAAQRHDLESEEVAIAALLHDLAELMLCCHRPEASAQIAYLVGHARGLRSAAAQRAVLGFTHSELQSSLAEAWHLPALLRRLMDDDHADHPRVMNVLAAVGLARHSSRGWLDAGLPDDLRRVETLTGATPDQAWRLVRNAALRAARNWQDDGVRPAASWLPMSDADGLGSAVPAPARGAQAYKQACTQIAAAPATTDPGALGALALYALHLGLGFRRVMLAEADPRTGSAATRFCLAADTGGHASWDGFRFRLGDRDLLGRLMERPQGVWAGGANRARLSALITPELRHRIGSNEFLAMSVFAGNSPRFLLIADHGAEHGPVPESSYAPFKAVCGALSQKLSTLRPG